MNFYLINIVIILCYGIGLMMCPNIRLRNGRFGFLIDKNKFFAFLSCAHLGLLMALRGASVGTDTQLYSRLYEQIARSENMFSVIKSAPIYVVYNKAVSLITNETQWIVVFNALVIMIGIGVFIYKNSSNAVMSIYFYITLYFYFKSFNISRQFIAVVLVANSYYFLKNNNIRKYLILIFAAIFIHNTAVVGLILFPLKLVKWTNIKIYFLAIATTIAMMSFDKLLLIFLRIFPRYKMYLINSTTSISDVSQGKKILVTFFYLAIVVLCMFYLTYKKQNELTNELYFLTAIMTIAVVIGIVFYNNILISRIEIYFSLFIIIYIPLVIKLVGKSKLFWYCSFMVITAIPMIVQLRGNISGVVPYNFFWNN